MMTMSRPACLASTMTCSRPASAVQTMRAPVRTSPVLQRTGVQPILARVVIRFARFGRKKLPFYRLVAIDSRKHREGKPLEYLGWYDPLKKETNLNAPAIKKWLGVGAQTSKTVGNLLQKAMVIDRKQVMSPAKTKGLAKHAANNATKKED
mmetsp:Transcript_1505/g.4468  ORF Transcript_1505/g.4468 Transcript_1505/m.4468 type:complete len:151 (-) Transcript_1505:648-1100(-)